MTRKEMESKLLMIAEKMPNDDLSKKHINWNKISKSTEEWLSN